MQRYLIGAYAILVVAAIAMPSGAAVTGRLEMVVEVNRPQLRTDSMGITRLNAKGSSIGALPGQPALPVQVLRVAVPPGADQVSLEVEPVATTTLPGYFEVAPAPPVGVIGDGTVNWRDEGRAVVAGRDTGIYQSDDLFPDSWGEIITGVQRLRRHRYVEVAVRPARYRAVTGEIVVADELRLRVSYTSRKTVPADQFDDCRREELARQILVNYEESLGWHGEDCLLPPPDSWENMVIVTTDALVADSQYLDEYIDMREGQGHEVTVATESDWDVSTGESHDDRSDRIHKWLKDHQNVLHMAWVLLIGNPDPSGGVVNSIPMKFCADYDGTVAPTDYFYAALSSNWDGNGDGTFCSDGDNIGFTADAYVGRIPIYSDGAAAMDDTLEKIIAYEEESESGDLEWRRRMMLPNSIYFFAGQYGDSTPRWDGATVGEYFIREQAGPRGMEWTSLYEHEGIDSSHFSSHFQVTTEEVVDQWNRGYGFVFWTGHGSDTGVYRSIWDTDNGDGYPDYQEMSSPNFMDAVYTHMLEGTPPPFVVHGSCSNGNPESANNLGYSLLRRGAIGTVSASRSALTWHWPGTDPEIWEKPELWDGDVIDIVTEYSDNLLNGEPAGKALEEAIMATTNVQGHVGWYQKNIQNLYGDPLMRLVMCRNSSECDNGLYCDGAETCQDGSCMPGDDIVCEPTADCDEWFCDEDAMGCVPSEECDTPEPDGGTDTDTEDTDAEPVEPSIEGAITSCSTTLAGRRGGDRPSLIAALLGLLV